VERGGWKRGDACMRAVVYRQPFEAAVEEVPDLRIEQPNDEAPSAYLEIDRAIEGYTAPSANPMSPDRRRRCS
jgi:hypothetical protein